MKNNERQASLDKQKYEESTNARSDLSGLMDYCYNCDKKQLCLNRELNYYDILKNCYCAKAYNAMVRKK